MYKPVILCAMLSVLLVLSGCYANRALIEAVDKSQESRWVATDTKDIIIAIGKPAKPIEGYENALVLVGQQHNYLIESTEGKNQLKRVFETVDLHHLSVYLPDGHIAVKEAGDWRSCPSTYGCAWDIILRYEKPNAHISLKEQNDLKNLGFYCSGGVMDKNQTVCSYYPHKVSFIPVQSSNPSDLSYRLKQPVPIIRYAFHKNKGKMTRVANIALSPIAIVFDVVTFPVQMAIWDGKRGNHN